MSDIFFEELAIPKPDYNLGIGSGNHGAQTGAMLAAIEEVLMKENPDWLLVYGDTNSTVAGALAAAKLHIPVIHVEAGLRSFDKRMPEEINRIITDHLSDLLICPTETAVANLKTEGIINGVHHIGDVMADAVLYNKDRASLHSKILETVGVSKGQYIAATIHRPSNTDSKENMESIFSAFEKSGKTIVFPIHPRTRKYLAEYQIAVPENVRLIEPLGYLDMLQLTANAERVVTDSGGVQKEAYILKVPCVTLRENTEWVETLNNGWNRLIDSSNTDGIVDYIQKPEKTGDWIPVFGDGHGSGRIVEVLDSYSHS